MVGFLSLCVQTGPVLCAFDVVDKCGNPHMIPIHLLLVSLLLPTAFQQRTSAAKAVERQTIYGTAEAVPFV